MKLFKLLSLFFIIFSSCDDKQSGVLYIDEPIDWVPITSSYIRNNIDRHNVESAKQFLKESHDSSKVIYAYKKYKTEKLKSLNPAIKIEIRNNSHQTNSDFFESIKSELYSWNKYFNDFKVIEEPTIIEIDNMKAMIFSITYNYKDNDTIWQARSKAIAIPNGNKSYQLFFNDGMNDDCSQVFNDLISSIRFEKTTHNNTYK